jgi:serine/threonine protein kinase
MDTNLTHIDLCGLRNNLWSTISLILIHKNSPKLCHRGRPSRSISKETCHICVHIADKPLVEDDSLFSYHMELLTSIDSSALTDVAHDVKAIVVRLYDHGLSHGDLDLSNIMRDRSGSLVIIDPSISGVLGEQIPNYIRPPQYGGDVFSTTVDER